MLSIFISALLGSAAVQASPIQKRSGGIQCGATNIINYEVVKGDTLGALAYKYETGICDIAIYNNITNPDLIEVGQKLAIPVNCQQPVDNTTCLTTKKTEAPVTVVDVPCPDEVVCKATQIATTTVVEGDTLGAFAYKYNTGICDIAKYNNISNPNLIILGQSISIPANCTGPIDNTTCITSTTTQSTVNATCIPETPVSYTIKAGDTLTYIANNFSVSLGALAAQNPQITNIDVIGAGQTISIPVASNYTVVSGDTFSAIATKFGLSLDALTAANPQVADINVIDVGQVLNLPICNSGSASSAQCPSTTYEIKSGDVFVDLASTYKTTIERIQSFNPAIDPSKLQVGQTIRLPTNCA